MNARALAVCALASFLLLSLAGCAWFQRQDTAAPAAAAPAEPAAPPPRELKLFSSADGTAITWPQLIERARQADVVIIGEQHGHEVGLSFAAALWEDLLASSDTAALSLEFITRNWQYLVDAYLAGLIDWEDFDEQASAGKGTNTSAHEPLIRLARTWNRPVYAANAPRMYSTAARKNGFDALREPSDAQKPMFDLPPRTLEGGYRDRFFDEMRGPHTAGFVDEPEPADPGEDATQEQRSEYETAHADWVAKVDEVIGGFFRGQLVWDATMAGTIARALEAGDHPVVHVVGQFHCDRDGGTVQLLRELKPDAKILVVTMAGAWSDSLREEDKDRADVVVYVGPHPAAQMAGAGHPAPTAR